MHSRNRAVLLTLLAGLCAWPALADNGALDLRRAYHVARLHIGDGRVVEDAYIVVDGDAFGQIVTGAPPDGLRVHEIAGGVALPGLVDAVTQLGLDGGAAESSEALTPGVRAADAFDADDRSLRAALDAGTNTIGLVPAAANLVAGRAAAASLEKDRVATLLTRRGPEVFSFRAPALSVNRVPATLAGARALLAAAFAGRAWRAPTESDPPVSADALAVLGALAREPVLVHVDTPESARVAAEILATRGLRPTFVGLSGCADDPVTVALLGAPCIVTGLDVEDSLLMLDLPGRLARAGVAVGIASGAPDKPASSLRMALALAVARGLPESDAVPAVTYVPARALGVAHRVGRVGTGLRADLLVLDGDPWDPRARVLLHLSGGSVVRSVGGTESGESAR